MRYYLLPLLSLALAFPLTAQAQTPAADTATTYKHQLGLTASPQLDKFFKANRSLPLGVLYQRQLSATKALRLRLIGRFSHADSANFIDDAIGIVDGYVTGPSYRQWQLQASAGYAWQRPLGRRLGLDYGLEAGLGYQRQGFAASRRYPYPPGGYVVDTYARTTQDFQAQVRPFAGISVYATARLRLFAESALPLTYTHQRMKYKVRGTFTKPDEEDRFFNQRARANRFALSWRPVQLVGISYAL